MALFVMASELLIVLQQNFVCWYIIVSWNFLSKGWIAVFKVSVKFSLISLLRTSSAEQVDEIKIKPKNHRYFKAPP